MVALKLAGGALVLVRAEDVAPGDIVNFLLTAALYKAKAHGKACPLALGGRRGRCCGPKPALVAGEMWDSNRRPFPT